MQYFFNAEWGKNFKGVVASPSCNGTKTYQLLDDNDLVLSFSETTGEFIILHRDDLTISYNREFIVNVYCNQHYQGTFKQIIKYQAPLQSEVPILFDDLVETQQTIISGIGFPGSDITIFVDGVQSVATLQCDSNGKFSIDSKTFAHSTKGIEKNKLVKVKQKTNSLLISDYSNTIISKEYLTCDIEVNIPTVSCSQGILNFRWLIRNLGSSSIPLGTVLTLSPNNYPLGGTYSSTKGTILSNLLTLTSKIYKDDIIDINYQVQSYDCGESIKNFSLKVSLPNDIVDECGNNEHVVISYIPLKSNTPILSEIYKGQSTLTGYGVPGSRITKIYRNENLEFEPNSLVLPDGTFSIGSLVSLPNEGDIYQVIQKTDGFRDSDISNTIIVGGPISITSKCVNGIRISGVDGITYEVIVKNYTRNKILGRRVFIGPQIGQSIFFNEQGLENSDLQVGDGIGIEVNHPCCTSMKSRIVPYNPLRNLVTNYSCINSIASINPIFAGGNFPIKLTLKLGDSIIREKILYTVTQDREITGIPNSENLKLIVSDSGYCEISTVFNSNCGSSINIIPEPTSNCSDIVLNSITEQESVLKLNFTLSGSSCNTILVQSSRDQINWTSITSNCSSPREVNKPQDKTYYRLQVACTGGVNKKSNVLSYNPVECTNYFAITDKTVTYLDCNSNQKTIKGPCNFSAISILQGKLTSEYSLGHQSGQNNCSEVTVTPIVTDTKSYIHEIIIYKSQVGSWYVKYINSLGDEAEEFGTIEQFEVGSEIVTKTICAKSIITWAGGINVQITTNTCN